MANRWLASIVAATALTGAYGEHDARMLCDLPGIVRLYDFGAGHAVPPNLAGADAPMAFASEPGSAPTRQPGREEGTFSVLLDAESFGACAPDLPSNALTVAVWLRPHRMGVKTGNDGLANGMVVSCGSGYYDGWRLALYDWSTRRPSFELGRPEGSFHVAAKDALAAGAWNHLAATWDGAKVRVYVNGMLSAEHAFPGTATPPNGDLKVGYSGYGVGSLTMSVDQLAVFDRALPADEVARMSLSFPRTPPTLRPHVARAQDAAAVGDAHEASAAYQSVATRAAGGSVWRHWALLAAARHVPRAEAQRPLLAILRTSAAPAHLRAQAATLLLQGVMAGVALPHGDLTMIASRIEAALDEDRLACAEAQERMARWTQARDLMAAGYWKYLWADSTVGVGAVDAALGTLRLVEKPGYGLAVGQPFHVQNLLEEIDRPGEWYLDRSNSQLYVWPTRHAWSRQLVLSRWDKPFVQATGVAHLVLEGLTFEHGQQRGIVLDGCRDTALVGCVVRKLGGTGVVARNANRLRIYGNILRTLGHAGMQVDGGDRRSLTGSGIVIENNDVGHFGRLTRTYTPALLLNGCGTRVAHNHFHHAPSSAMRIEGNDHLIEYNLVDHVVRESDDQGALDMWRDPSYRGVVIRFNRWVDIGTDAPCGQAAIRLDDAISGVLILGNRFERASRGNFGAVQIHGGRDNVVDNNVFIGCRYGVSFSPWEPKRWQAFLASDELRPLLYEQVDIRTPPYSERYPGLATLSAGPSSNTVMRNVFVDCGETFYQRPPETSEWANRTCADVPDQAAARTWGFPALPPLADMGLYDDPRCARE